MPKISVVVPAYNAERTIGRVLDALAAQQPPPDEVIVVDDGSTDRTKAISAERGARVISTTGGKYAGGARNLGWEAATGEIVVFLDSDAIPAGGWTAGLLRAVSEYPGAIIGCARTFRGTTPWGWVAHLQLETPYLPLGRPRHVRFVSSCCMAVPRALTLRFDESYGGEDGVFSADAVNAGIPLVFDPRFEAHHDHSRSTYHAMRAQQRRRAYALARLGPVQRESVRKRIFARVPVHYFLLVRLPRIYGRIRRVPELHDAFVGNLPRLVLAEWTRDWSALRYVVRKPAVRGQTGAGFR